MGIDLAHLAGFGRDFEVPTVAVQQWYGAAPPAEYPPHSDGMLAETLALVGYACQNEVICPDKFLHIVGFDDVEVADDPAAVLEIPIVAQTDEFIIAVDVRKKRKAPAGNRAVLALAKLHTLAFNQLVIPRQFVLDFAIVRCRSFERMPKVGTRLQVLPFLNEDHRNGLLRGAAKRCAVVVRRALLAAIEPRHRRIEIVIEDFEIFWLERWHVISSDDSKTVLS